MDLQVDFGIKLNEGRDILLSLQRSNSSSYFALVSPWLLILIIYNKLNNNIIKINIFLINGANL